MRTSPWGLIPTARRQAGKQEVAATTATSCLLAGEEGGKEKKGICPENPLGFSVFRETLKQQLLAFFWGCLGSPKIVEKFRVAPNNIEKPHIFLF